jgi:hypothetical protein
VKKHNAAIAARKRLHRQEKFRLSHFNNDDYLYDTHASGPAVYPASGGRPWRTEALKLL